MRATPFLSRGGTSPRSRRSLAGPPRPAPLAAIRNAIALWVFVCAHAAGAQTPLPEGAVSLINQDRFGSLVALCAETGEPAIQQGARTIRRTAVWVGQGPSFYRVRAGLGTCDPAWSPDGRRLAVTAAEGLWVFPADSPDGALRVRSRVPLGASEFNYRAFSSPRWSPDGILLAVVVRNGGTSWVEIFEARTGRLFYTSPPENHTFSWTSPQELKLGETSIHLPR